MTRTITAALGTIALIILVGIACTKKKSNDYGLDIRETLRVNIMTEPPTLDYLKGSDSTSQEINLNIMEGLADYDFYSTDLKPIPALAENWESSEKNKVWTFHLRKGVKWTDGVELKAQQFVDSVERLLNPQTASPYSYAMYVLKNGQSYFEGKVKDFKDVGIKANDDYTLVYTLKSPISFFPYLLTHHSTYPIRKDVIEKFGNSAFTDPTKMVTIGAYRMKTWEHDKIIILERNEGYYGEKAKTKYVLAQMINEDATALNLFDSGKLDFIPEFPSIEMQKQESRPEFVRHPALIIQYFGFNTKKKPLDNPWLRKAIVASINREEVVALLKAGQPPMTSWIPKGMFGYDPERGIKFDPAKAKEYLSKAGFTETKKPAKITIEFNTSDEIKQVAENLQAQIKKNLGIDVELQNAEWKVYLDKLRTNPPHMYRFAWGADYPDPDNVLGIMTSYSSNNHSNWKNKSFDDLIEKGVAESDQVKRAAIYSQAQKYLLEEDCAVLPLYSSVRTNLISKRVENFPINPLDLREFKKVSLKQ